jgi:hypothetical protein
MTERNEQQVPYARLAEAVAQGIITADQLAAIGAMAAGAGAEPAAEARRELNAVTIAYFVGGAAVVFAFGWFLVDRWEALGPAGVLAVSLVYAALFVLAGRFLGGLGFRTAASVAALLAVVMAPVVAWSLLDLAGLWYEPSAFRGLPYAAPVDVLESLRWIPLELAGALAALVALRRVRFGLLALPAAVALPFVISNLLPLALDPDIVNGMLGWAALVSGTATIACGYAVERRPRDDEDYAYWVYLTGLVTLAFAVLAVWNSAGHLRHALPVLAAGLFALSLFLRRPVFMVFGAVFFVGYLAYLAFDVFRTALSFPIVLATFGIGVIVITVWLQRRYPALARQVEARQAGRRAVPHAGLVFGGALAVAAALFAAQLPGAHDRAADARAHARRAALEAYRAQRRRAPGDSMRATRIRN